VIEKRLKEEKEEYNIYDILIRKKGLVSLPYTKCHRVKEYVLKKVVYNINEKKM
jgi:hypothetical protein